MRPRDGPSVSGAAYRRQHVHDLRRVRTHLEVKSAPLTTVILTSWGIGFFEYRLHRYPAAAYSTSPLKGMQEVVTWLAIAVFPARR